MNDRDVTMDQCAEYIKGEYGDDLGITELILKRHGYVNPQLAMEITGYFTGCMTIGGEPRTHTAIEPTTSKGLPVPKGWRR